MDEKEEKVIKIALCDDEDYCHEEVDEIIKQYEYLRGIEVKLIHFYNSKELLEYNGLLHILLLDIFMPDLDGIEAGRILRENRKDYRIIMLTSMKEKAGESMKIGAFRFIEKPLKDGEALFEALDDALITFIGYKKIEVKFENTVIEIFQHQIDYIKSMGNYVKLYVGDKIFEKITSLRKIEDELDKRIFFKTDKSHIVNLSCIEDFNKNKCVLVSGARIPVSRREIKKFKETYSLFDAKGYNGIRNGYFY